MPRRKAQRCIGVTSFSQFIRLENCERFLRLRIFPDEVKAYRTKWHITEQPLTPLLAEAGAEFEKHVDELMVRRGKTPINLDVSDHPADTLAELQKVDKPVVLLQAPLSGALGQFPVQGKADAMRLERSRAGEPRAIIADVKASRKEQIAFAAFARATSFWETLSRRSECAARSQASRRWVKGRGRNAEPSGYVR